MTTATDYSACLVTNGVTGRTRLPSRRGRGATRDEQPGETEHEAERDRRERLNRVEGDRGGEHPEHDDERDEPEAEADLEGEHVVGAQRLGLRPTLLVRNPEPHDAQSARASTT